VSDERDHAALGPQAHDDVHVVREDGHFVNMYLTARSGFTNGRAHCVGISSSEGALAEARVPRDVHVQAEGSMGHWWLG
jgi:hypothetical protein